GGHAGRDSGQLAMSTMATAGARLRLILAILSLWSLLVAAHPQGSRAETINSSSYLNILFDAGDVVGAYDHNSTSNARTNADWPVTLLIRGNAEIDKVKAILQPYYSSHGGPMYEYLKDGSGYTWDTDSGKKDPAGCIRRDTHLRLDADGDDRMYNPTDGY